MIQVDLQNIRSFIPLPYEAALSPRLRIAHDHLQNGDGAGGEFTGWVRLPEDYDKAEFTRIKAAAQRIHDALCAGEVHVRDEHRDHALRRGVPLKAMRAPAIHAAEQFFVKIHVSVLDSIIFYIK